MIKGIIFDLDGTLIQLPINYDVVQKNLKELFNISDQDIVKLEIPTGNPLFLDLDNSCKIKSARYLNLSRAEKIPEII